MKQETTRVQTATRPSTAHTLATLTGSLYGAIIGLALALLLLSGLVPSAWAENFPAGPFAFQGLGTAAGAVLGTVVARLRALQR